MPMELVSALRPLEIVEQELAEVYQELSRRFEADEEASRIFARLAFDEQSHVQEIQFLRRVSRQNPAEYASVDLELPNLLAQLETIQEFHKRLQEVALEEAVRFALAAETGAAETHARAARNQAHPIVSSRLAGLSEADRRHLGMIESFATGRGVRQDLPRKP